MLHGTVHGFDVYFTVYATNQAFGRAPGHQKVRGTRQPVFLLTCSTASSDWPGLSTHCLMYVSNLRGRS